MKKCPKCLATLNENAKFCKECGAKVKDLNLTEDRTESPETDLPETSQKVSSNHNSAAAKESTTITLDNDLIKKYIFEYGSYLKESLLHPYSLFKSENWMNGLLSLIIFAVIQMFVVNYNHVSFLLNFLVFQAIAVGLLLIINKGVLNNSSSVYDVLAEYGGLMNTQSILFIVAGVIGINEDAGALIMFIALLNQFNIYNYYLFNNQTKQKSKIDSYYQILIAYIALSILAYYAFRMFLGF